MSKATKRKHVTKELLDNYDVPTDNQSIVRVLGGRGNNLHEVETGSGEKYLVSMPSKFRKNVWLKRGCFVVVEPIEEGNKVKAEIVHILLKDQIKYLREEGKWPSVFTEDEDQGKDDGTGMEKTFGATGDSDDSSSSDDLPVNPNRPNIMMDPDSDDSSDEASSEEDNEEVEEEDKEDKSNVV